MTASEYKAKQAEILLKVFRPHPYLQPEDKLFLADPKLVEAAQALDDLFLEVLGEDEEARTRSEPHKLNPEHNSGGYDTARIVIDNKGYDWRNKFRASIRAIITGGEG